MQLYRAIASRDNFGLSKVPETEIGREPALLLILFSQKLICNLLTRAGKAIN